MLGYLVDPQKQFMSKGGDILVGGHLEVYLVGTDDRAVTYSDFVGTLNPADITLDANGRAVVVADSDMSYRVEVYSAGGALEWTVSPALVGGGSFVAVDGKVDKVNGATEGHFASLTEDGDIEDSGYSPDDFLSDAYKILPINDESTTFAKIKEVFDSGKIPLLRDGNALLVPSSSSDVGYTFTGLNDDTYRREIINNAGKFHSLKLFNFVRVISIYSSLTSFNKFSDAKDLLNTDSLPVLKYQGRFAYCVNYVFDNEPDDFVYFKFEEPFVYYGSKVYGITYKENDIILDYGAETERTDFGAVISPSDIADEDVEYGSMTIVCEIKGMQFRCAYHTKQQTTSSQFFFDIVDKDYADDWSESPVTLYDMQSFIYYPFRSTNDTQAVRNNWYDLITQPDGSRGGATLSFTIGDYRIPWYTYVGEPFDMEGWVKAVKGGHYMLFHYRIDGRYTADKIGFKVTLIDEGAV